MRLNKLTDAELVRYHRIAYEMLCTYQSKRAWHRLERIVVALERRGL